MPSPNSRRQFLKSAALGGMAWSAAEWSFLGQLPAVSAAEQSPGKIVALNADIEPLVRLIEETPRERVLEQVSQKILSGTTYPEVLAALQLAGVRNVQPKPSVGFKFHSVLVVNSCHLASVAGPADERWLPIFWALDYFKSAQAEEASKTGWKMGRVDEARVPSPENAEKMFAEAMDRWDVEQADPATAGIVRHLPAAQVFQLFARYAARDFRAIGHKAIFLANAWRTLEVIGWRHAEPILRSLTFALLNHNGESNPADGSLEPDRPWRESQELAKRIPDNWAVGTPVYGATSDLISTFRQGGWNDSTASAAEMLQRNVPVASIWDGVFVGAGELLMRQPGIVALHGLTSANALHYLWSHSSDEQLRRRLVLQACSFNSMFRGAAQQRGKLAAGSILDVAPLGGVSGGPFTVEEIFADVSGQPLQAARKLNDYLATGGDARAILDVSRRLLFQKGRDAHDYKFSSAVLEDFAHVSPEWRSQYLALSVFNLKGTGDRDSDLLNRTRAALTS
jgi:hypothetical protein